MKHLPHLFLAACMAAFIFACGSPQKNAAAMAERSFKVWGNCDQCKEAIEAAASLPGTSQVSWSEKTNLLVFKMDTSATNDEAILKAVASAGYDNEKYTADDAAYKSLPECCQYERKAAGN